MDLTVLPAPTLPGLLSTDFGHADELIEQGLHRARAELRRHHAPARSLRNRRVRRRGYGGDARVV